MSESYKKTKKNPIDYKIIYSKDSKATFKRKVVPRQRQFKGIDIENSVGKPRLFKQLRSPQDTYSADKQMKKLKERLPDTQHSENKR